MRTTDGWLSRGASFATTIYGAQNAQNVFRVYSNAAPLTLVGGHTDDQFMVYAFKEAQVNPDGSRDYVENAPVSIDGGAGLNTFSVLGSEEADSFAVTQEGIRGAGLNTSYRNVQRVNLDAREGNDHLYILSTRPGVVTTLVGGLGSDTFDLAGDIDPHTIVAGSESSRDVRDDAQPVAITASGATLAADGSNSVTLSVALNLGVLGQPASGQAYVALDSAMFASALYGSLSQGTGFGTGTTLASATGAMQGRGLLFSTDNGATWHQSVVLAFDATGASWAATQTVLVRVEDGTHTGQGAVSAPLTLAGQLLPVSASLFTTLPNYRDVALAPLNLQVTDPGAQGNTPSAVMDPRATDHPAIVVDPATGVSYADYPAQPHDVSGLQGAVVLEGTKLANPDYNLTLHQGITLPTETDGVLAPRATGGAQSVPNNDRVNVFDDGTTQGQVGEQGGVVQTSGLAQDYGTVDAQAFARLMGLGMTAAANPAVAGQTLTSVAGAVDLTNAQGTTVSFDNGVTMHALQSVNTMLGQGDDTYTVSHAAVGAITLVQGGGGNNTLIASGSTVGGSTRPVLLFGAATQDDSWYVADPTQRRAGYALAFANTGNNTLDASTTTQGVILYGGAGNDTIIGGSGNDLIAGGGGSNTIAAGQGDNIVWGNAGMNLSLDAPLNLAAVAPTVDLQSLPDLTLVLTPADAAANAQAATAGGAADRLTAGSNTITAGDGNNIVFANYGSVTLAGPYNYLRDRGDFINPAPASQSGNFIAGTGLVSLQNFNLPSGTNSITVGNGSNALFGGMGADTIRSTGPQGHNLVSGDGAQASFDSTGNIAQFITTYPGVGGNDTIYNNGTAVALGGAGDDTIQGGVGRSIMFGDYGLVNFTDNQPVVISTLLMGQGGDDTLLAGTGSNIMLGGGGKNNFSGDMSKDVMIGNYATLILNVNGDLQQMNRPGLPNGPTDLVTSVLVAIYASQSGSSAEFTVPLDSETVGALLQEMESWQPITLSEGRSGILLEPQGAGSLAQGPGVVMIDGEGNGLAEDSGGASARPAAKPSKPGASTGTAPAGTKATEPPSTGAQAPAGQAPAAGAAGQGAPSGTPAGSSSPAAGPSGTSSAAPASPSAAAALVGAHQVSLAAGVSVLGLAGVLGSAGPRKDTLTVVFDAASGSWQRRAKRGKGPSVLDRGVESEMTAEDPSAEAVVES
ncbi:hypothetical protein CDEF62S_03693 [Castellaniella defragrans]